MTRLLVTASLLAAVFAVAAGSGTTPGGELSPGQGLEPSLLCKSGSDGGTRPRPHGLLMVADRDSAPPCAQGG